jgi:hypothetical protein
MGTFGLRGRQNTPTNFWQILVRPQLQEKNCQMSLLLVLHWISAIAAFVAAILWLLSARVVIPSITHPIGSSTTGVQPPPHEAAFRRQARLSAFAALSAAIAAVTQGVTLIP